MDLSSKLFGNSNDYTFEHRLFNVVTLFSIVIAGVGKLINYYLEIVKLGSIPILVYLIITTLLYYNSRFRNKFRNYVWWYILSSIVLLSFIWLENGGYNSSNTLIFVLLFVVMSAIVKERRQFLIFVVLFIVLMALHLVAYFKPEYVGGYENEEIRFLDILITTLYIITALFAFLKIYRKNYIIEREKANSRKIEVEKLNKTLEDSNNKINIQNQKLEDLSNDLIKKHLIIKTQLKEINKANSELKSLNHTKDKFFAIISHDLKNPVGSFKSITESIKDNFEFYSEAEQKDIINLMSQSSNKLYDLLINLLTWANIQTGSLTLNPGFNDMSKLIKENEDLFRLSALNKGIQIVNKVQSPVTAYFDYEMIDTVIRNLISNAIKFTPKDGLVEINSFKDDNNLRIDITDNGVGISDEDLKLMFRIDVNYKLIGENENEKGTGLGLILCKEFVELNKGSINIRSVLGKGTTISFNLPLNNI